jgi:hypothetical protein
MPGGVPVSAVRVAVVLQVVVSGGASGQGSGACGDLVGGHGALAGEHVPQGAPPGW